ncbi:MAG TPA: hypothetical protein VIY48_21930 [Candidatus Paceibacterota bacterium]
MSDIPDRALENKEHVRNLIGENKENVRKLIGQINELSFNAMKIFDEQPLKAFNLCADIELAVIEIMDLWTNQTHG